MWVTCRCSLFVLLCSSSQFIRNKVKIGLFIHFSSFCYGCSSWRISTSNKRHHARYCLFVCLVLFFSNHKWAAASFFLNGSAAVNAASVFHPLLSWFGICRCASFRHAESGWPLHSWTTLVKPWWACGGHTPPWMSLTRQTAPQKRPTASANSAPPPRSTPCACRCASGCHCVPSRPTPYRRTPPGRTPRSSPDPALSAKWPAALATPSLKCVR